MDVLLHIGPAKTGSTSIQKTLNGFDDGVTKYLEFQKDNTKIFNNTPWNHSQFIKYIFEESFFKKFNIKNSIGSHDAKSLRASPEADFKKEITRSDKKKIIISGEGLGPLKGSAIRKLKFFLEHNNCNIQIFAFYRDPQNKLASKLQQTSKGKAFSLLDSSFKGWIPRPIDVTLAGWAKHFPKEKIFVHSFYKEDLVDGCTVETFCSFAKVKPINKDNTSNQSMSFSALRLIYSMNQILNKEGIDKSNRRKFHRLIRDIYNDEDKIDKKLFKDILDLAEFNNEKKFLKECTTFLQPKKDEPRYHHNGTSIFKRLKLKYARFTLHKELQNLKNIDFDIIDKYLETLGKKPSEISALSSREKIIALYKEV